MISPTAISQIAAHAIYDSSKDRECRWLHLEWAIDHFVAADAAAHFTMAMESYQALRSGNHTADNRFEYNDLDCHAFTVPWKDNWRAFAHEGQSVNNVYVLQQRDESDDALVHITARLDGHSESKKMRVYQYWEMPPDDPKDAYMDEYSDCPDGEHGYGPSRPTLKWLIEHGSTKYDDCRDNAFIVKTADMMGKSEHTAWNLMNIRWALFNINSLWTALECDRAIDPRKLDSA